MIKTCCCPLLVPENGASDPNIFMFPTYQKCGGETEVVRKMSYSSINYDNLTQIKLVVTPDFLILNNYLLLGISINHSAG